MPRSTLTDRIFALLDHERVDVRCAAALVLGTAGGGDPAVAKALAAKLSDENAMMRRFVLDALEATGARGLADRLAPLLGTTDEEIRGRVLRLLAGQGPQAEGALVAELEQGTSASRKQVAQLLVRLGTPGALDALFRHIADADIGEQVLQLLRGELDMGEKASRIAIKKRAAAAVARLAGKGRKGPEPANVPRLAATIRLLGYIADPAGLPVLLAHSGPRAPLPVRMAAIAGMRRLVANPSVRADKAIEALIGYANDADPSIARAAVDTLRGAHIPDKLAKAFASLAKSRNPDAQRLAAERLAALAGPAAIPTLIQNLLGGDPQLRDAASRSLMSAPEAAGPLAKALADAESEDAARRLATALRPHASRVPKAAIEALARAAQARLKSAEAGDRTPAILLEALAHLAPEAHAQVLVERATALRRAGRYQEAFAALRPLAHSGARLDDDQRFFIGVLGLKAGGKNLLRSARGVDPVLAQFVQLVGAGYPVARSLAKQKDLDLEDLFTLGFNFIESAEDHERELGQELLDLVAKKQPRGKFGVAAKNKLKLAGAA